MRKFSCWSKRKKQQITKNMFEKPRSITLACGNQLKVPVIIIHIYRYVCDFITDLCWVNFINVKVMLWLLQETDKLVAAVHGREQWNKKCLTTGETKIWTYKPEHCCLPSRDSQLVYPVIQKQANEPRALTQTEFFGHVWLPFAHSLMSTEQTVDFSTSVFNYLDAAQIL